jgi:signal transduction histidine kinase
LEILNIVGTGHLCVCFEAPEQRLAALVPHVALGLEQGEKCIYIANGDGPAAVGALRAAGVDVDAASKRAALLVIERRQTPLADGPFEPARLIDWWRRCADDAAKEGFSKICVAAEMFAVVGPGYTAEAVGEYEVGLELLVRELSFRALCLYERKSFDAPTIRQALATHPLVVVNDAVYRNSYQVPPGEYLARGPWAEIDWILRNLQNLERAEDNALVSEDRYRKLARRLMDVYESERRSLARDLHDDLGQLVSAVRLNLQRRDAGTKKRLAETIGLVDGALQRLREVAHDLRPVMLDELGLPAALSWYAKRETERADLELRLDVDATGLRLSADMETACFRIAQEALTNVVRHAHARTVDVRLHETGNVIELEVRDDGRGFAQETTRPVWAGGGGQGLVGMQERAAAAGGLVEVESHPGQGTTVRARFSIAYPGKI